MLIKKPLAQFITCDSSLDISIASRLIPKGPFKEAIHTWNTYETHDTFEFMRFEHTPQGIGLCHLVCVWKTVDCLLSCCQSSLENIELNIRLLNTD
jgi:hypothetical protein